MLRVVTSFSGRLFILIYVDRVCSRKCRVIFPPIRSFKRPSKVHGRASLRTWFIKNTIGLRESSSENVLFDYERKILEKIFPRGVSYDVFAAVITVRKRAFFDTLVRRRFSDLPANCEFRREVKRDEFNYLPSYF